MSMKPDSLPACARVIRTVLRDGGVPEPLAVVAAAVWHDEHFNYPMSAWEGVSELDESQRAALAVHLHNLANDIARGLA